MQFPVILYRAHTGGTWPLMGSNKLHKIMVVDDAAGLEAALSNGQGWFLPGVETADVAPVADNAPPTRAELTQEARRLGIRFGPRTSDTDLLAKINAAHGEG